MSATTDNNKHITSQMIADFANVSRATVTRVMKNEPYVKESVRARVKKIIEEYDYKPNYAGSALVHQKKRVKIGIVGLNTQNPLYNEIYRGALQAAEEYKGLGIEILFRNTHDITCKNEIISAIEELMSKDIQGMAVLGIDDVNVQKAIQAVQDKIPVVPFNTNISHIKKLCFVGQDSKKSGRTAGALMCMLMNKGNIIVVANSLKVLAVSDRIVGFEKRIKETNCDLTITGVYENESSDEKSYEIIKKLCNKDECIDGIYIVSGFGSGGVCTAIEECGLTNVKIIAHDMLPDTLENIRKGRIAFTIGQELKRQGYLPIDILVKYLIRNDKPKLKKIYTKIDIYNTENI